MCRPLAIPIKAGGLSYHYQEWKGDISLFSVVETNITIHLTMILIIIHMRHELPYLAGKKKNILLQILLMFKGVKR